jgi:hypothetical protein
MEDHDHEDDEPDEPGQDHHQRRQKRYEQELQELVQRQAHQRPATTMLTMQSYADDILARGADAQRLAGRIQALADGCVVDADTHFDPGKSAHTHIARRWPATRASFEDTVGMGWTECCTHCPRTFPTARSRKAHENQCKWRKVMQTVPGPETEQQWAVHQVVAVTGPPYWRFYRVRWDTSPDGGDGDGTAEYGWEPAHHLSHCQEKVDQFWDDDGQGHRQALDSREGTCEQ